MSAHLTFTATVQGVKVSVAKGAYDNGSAYADVTFRIESPKKPSTPRRHGWDYDHAAMTISTLGLKGELSEKDREKLAEARAAVRADDEKWRENRAAYAREMQNVAPRLMAYAQIAGLVAVFGGQPVTITLEPQAQDFLPGLDVMMLPAPEHDDDGRYGDAGEDLEDEDRDDDDTDVVDA